MRPARRRTRIAIPMVLLAVVPALSAGALALAWADGALVESALGRVADDTAARAREVSGFLRSVQQDLLFLARAPTVRRLADAEGSGDAAALEPLRRRLEEELVAFSRGKHAYYQVRYLDDAGREVVRLDAERGEPRVVPHDELQDKGDRYYVDAARRRAPGEIYVSPMDLNVERGIVEVPARGVLRCATPVRGEAGRGRGLMILNLHGDYLLSLAGAPTPAAASWLVDERGTYLGAAGSGAGLERYGLDKGRRLLDDHAPGIVRRLLAPEGATLRDGGLVLTSAPVVVDQQEPGRRWTLLVGQPAAPLVGPIRRRTAALAAALLAVVAAAGGAAALLAGRLARAAGR